MNQWARRIANPHAVRLFKIMNRRNFISSMFALAVAPVVSKFVPAPAPIPSNDYFKSTIDVESVPLTPKILRDAKYHLYGGARGGGKLWSGRQYIAAAKAAGAKVHEGPGYIAIKWNES